MIGIHDPLRMQASRRSVAARGVEEVDSARASEYAAPVVGAVAVGFVAGSVAGGGAEARLKEDIDFHMFLLYFFGSLKKRLDKDGY